MTDDNKNSQLDEVQRQLLDRLAKNDSSGFKQLLGQLKGGVNFVDDSGMSCLAHASFKGNREAVQLLLELVGIIRDNPTTLYYSSFFCRVPT